MKTNVNIFNELNESLEKELSAKRALKESERKALEDKAEKLEDKIKNTKVEDLDSKDAKELEKIEDKLEDETLTEESTIENIKKRLTKLSDEEAAKYQEITTKPEDLEESKEELNEDTTIQINGSDPDKEIDYIINDVTVLEPVADGDVQAPDIDGLLTLVSESLSTKYGENWGHINILSSRVEESSSFALVDISTPEILREFEEKGIEDVAIGKNLILENAGKLLEFKVNSLNGVTRFSKKTNNAIETITEWIESEFLHEAAKEKAKCEELEKVKEQKEVTENYIAGRPELRQEIENIKMFIELSKQVKAKDEMKPAIQDRMYGFAVEFPLTTEITNKDDKYELKFNTIDDIVEVVFGKEWVKEKEEIPEVIELTEDIESDMYIDEYYSSEEDAQRVADKFKAEGRNAKIEKQGNEYAVWVSYGKMNESYSQFNIGDIEVVFNPETYECLYSIPSAEVKDKKINLTKIPTVATPYDTNTIIKSYVETKFGQIPSEEEKKMIDNQEVSAPEMNTEVYAQEDIPVEEAELPEEPTEGGIEGEPAPQEQEEIQAETGDATFVKIRPKQESNIEAIRERMLDGDTPKSSYIIVGEKDLPAEEWNELISNLTNPQPWLEGVKAIDRKNYSFNVLRVSSSAAEFALLIDPLGYNYPRYVAIQE